MKLPTDLQILELIYKEYYKPFSNFSRTEPDRTTKNYVPIDIDELGKELCVDGDIVFGRLYFYFNKKFSYRQEDDSLVDFFALRIKEDKHCIQFPLMASVLADLKYQNKKYNTTKLISIISLGIAVASVIIAVVLNSSN